MSWTACRQYLSAAVACVVVTGSVACAGSAPGGDATMKTWMPRQGSLPTSYVTPNANGTQNGRVMAAYRPLAAIEKVASLQPVHDSTGAPIPPATVLVPERGPYVVIDYGPGLSYQIRRQDGERLSIPSNSWTTRPRGAASIALDDGAIVGADLIGVARPQIPLSRVGSSRPLASLYRGDLLLSVDLTAPLQRTGEESEEVPWMVHAGLRRRGEGTWDELWYFTNGGPDRIGCAAIDATGQVAIATKDGHFMVVGPEGTSDGRASGKIRRRIARAPYLMSAIGDGWVLVEPRRPPLVMPPLTGLETFDDLVRRAKAVDEERDLTYDLYVDPARSKLSWKSGVVALDAEGNEQWSAEVPFRVLSPPINASNGLVLVVGEGMAAIQHGKLVWSESAAIRMLATAFQDGTIAIAAGRELRLAGPDRATKQLLQTPENEPITTPPAIAADGSIWFATAKGLYVAR